MRDHVTAGNLVQVLADFNADILAGIAGTGKGFESNGNQGLHQGGGNTLMYNCSS